MLPMAPLERRAAPTRKETIDRIGFKVGERRPEFLEHRLAHSELLPEVCPITCDSVGPPGPGQAVRPETVSAVLSFMRWGP
jgi:hypothetical protein